jgi:UDP-glucose 4-epimerase
MAPNPGSPYAVTKIAAEHYLFTLGKLYGLQAVALRIFNAYGPGQRIPPAHAPVVPLFLKRALGGGSLVIHGSGRQSRDFVYIDDAVRGLAAAGLTDAAVGQIINIGSGEETTLKELVRQVTAVSGRELSVLTNEAQNGGVSRLVADLAKARQVLGFQPQIHLREGLKLLLEKDPQFDRKR